MVFSELENDILNQSELNGKILMENMKYTRFLDKYKSLRIYGLEYMKLAGCDTKFNYKCHLVVYFLKSIWIHQS